MRPLQVITAPARLALKPAKLALTPARLALRTLDDLHTLADSVRQGPQADRDSLMSRLKLLHTEVTELNRHAHTVTGQATDLIVMARSLDAVARQLHGEAEELSENMEPVIESLDRIDDVTESVETLVDSVEPFQGAAARVGRIADRFSRRGGD